MIHHRWLKVLAPLAASGLSLGCASFPEPPASRVPALAAPPDPATALGRQMMERTADASFTTSGFVVVDAGWDALAWRCAMADRAERSLDMQYYIWNPDDAGILFSDRLLRAADRGVHIRILLDDMAVRIRTKRLASLDAHSNIEIRVYNPVGHAYEDLAQRGINVAGAPKRANRRMHNKLLVADSAVAITGGRNIGDEYFDLSDDFNFRDRDVVTIGPVVTNLHATFDTFWNSSWVVEFARVARYTPSSNRVARYYHSLHEHAERAARDLPDFDPQLAIEAARLTNLWAECHLGTARVVCDEPGKNDQAGSMSGFGASGRILTESALAAQRELIVQSAYALAMPGTMDLLRALRRRGVKVRLLANSSNSIDAPFVFAKYAPQRIELLALGVDLYEFRPEGALWRDRVPSHAPGEKNVPVGLHAKTVVFDGRYTYIGSFNMDPRSTHLNTELGLLIDCPALADEVRATILRDCGPDTSWRVVQAGDGLLNWVGADHGKPRTWDREPRVSWGLRVKLFFFRILPVKAIL